MSIMTEKSVYRCQYLLLEVGTKTLRQIFDVKVGHDFAAYLARNTTEANIIQSLIAAKKINPDQARHLPPIDNKPTSSNFDISLLTCMLRNVCGMAPSSNMVWMFPLPTDTSVEADISRLRMLRNELMHGDTLTISETYLIDKWKELTTILLRLNNVAGIPHLQSDINKAEHIELDEQLAEHFKRALKGWADNDHMLDSTDKVEKQGIVESEVAKVQPGIVDVQSEVAEAQPGIVTSEIAEIQPGIVGVQSEIAGVQLNLDYVQSNLGAKSTEVSTDLQNMTSIKRKLECVSLRNKRMRPVEFKDIKQWLIDRYQTDFSALPISPLLMEEYNAESSYQFPAMNLVDYHRRKDDKMKNESVTSYRDVFYDGESTYRNIFITGDAGVGKTSFCRHMCLLWSRSKSGDDIESSIKGVECLAKFDFMFYLSLRDSDRRDVIAIIVDQLFDTESAADWSRTYELVENLLREYKSLIILDGLDEWTPATSRRRNSHLPNRMMYGKCTYLTTTRPFVIESRRLTPRDIDNQIQIAGLHGSSLQPYVESIVTHLNEVNNTNRNPMDFLSEMKQCGLDVNFCTPVIVTHLVCLWFETKLSNMSIALLYGNIVDIIFRSAEMKGLVFPPSCVEYDIHVPDSLIHLHHLVRHASLLQQLCLLSFRSLFKQDEDAANLVFTLEQLMSEPYYCSEVDIDFFCKTGILSKNKLIGRFGKRTFKLSFLHKGFLEFFAALFVFQNENIRAKDNITTWLSINDVVHLQNFFLFLSEFSYEAIQTLFEHMYHSLSDEMVLSRKKLIFEDSSLATYHNDPIMSLQNIVINCFKQYQLSVRHDDFIFDDRTDVAILCQLLLLNAADVKSLVVDEGIYHDVFDTIKNIQLLRVNKVLSEDIVRFTKLMLSNHSTLHTVCIDGRYESVLLPELPVRSLHHLTSLSLSNVTMKHEQLHDLLTYLSDNVLMENIILSSVFGDSNRFQSILNISHHAQLESLCLHDVDIACKNVNTSKLKSITLIPLPWRSVDDYIGIFKPMKYSHLEHLEVDGCNTLNDQTERTLMTTVNSLPRIKSLILCFMTFHGDAPLQLHNDVTQVNIELIGVTMSHRCFKCFIESCIKKQYVIKVRLVRCTLKSDVGGTHMTPLEESVDYMCNYLSSIQSVNIVDKTDFWLHFETTSCQ